MQVVELHLAVSGRFRPPLATSCCASPPRVAPSSSAALASPPWPSLALAMSFSSPARGHAERHLAAAVANAGTSSLPSLLLGCRELLRFKPFPFLSFCLCRVHPEHRAPPPPPSSTLATPCSPWAAAVHLPLPTMTPWGASPHLTDTPRPLLVAGFPPEPPRRHSPPLR
jgi:hypothetical protein